MKIKSGNACKELNIVPDPEEHLNKWKLLFISILTLFHKHIKLKVTKKINIVFANFYDFSFCSLPKQPKERLAFLGVFGKFR